MGQATDQHALHDGCGAAQSVLAWDREAKRDGVRRRLLVSSTVDVFEDRPQASQQRADTLALLASCESLVVQVLTDRPENVVRMVPPAWLTAWPAHVWIGCAVEDQRHVEARIPHLLRVPASARFLVCAMREAIDLAEWLGCRERLTPRQTGAAPFGSFCSVMACPEETPCPVHRRLAWVIVEGQIGAGAPPFDLAWARDIVRQCREARVPVFVRQMGDNAVETSRVCPQHPDGFACGDFCKHHRFVTESACFDAPHGADPSEWPEDLRVRELPR